jgi:hypothetical protein
MSNMIEEVEVVARETNAMQVANPVIAALVADLGPVADRIALYQQQAQGIAVRTQLDADIATEVCDRIAADVKAVKGHEVLSRVTDGLHKLHRRWTGLRDAFVTPLESSRKEIRTKVIDWQETERKRAEELQRKLQAEADEKARREKARSEAEAAKLKTPEKREERLEQAAAVVAPVVHVEQPKVNMRGVARVWKVMAVDADAFYAALATDKSLRGYVEVDQVRMQLAKAANPAIEIPGVRFELVTR